MFRISLKENVGLLDAFWTEDLNDKPKPAEPQS